jgi:hypothetical protein
MQIMSSYFEDFRKAIEPDKTRKKEAQKADDPVREHLEGHESFADHHVTTFLYGSYKRSTAIGDIKDVDIVVITNYTTDDDPIDVLDDLKDALTELYEEPDLADQRRSIRIDRPLPDVPDSELTLDIIPAIYQDEDDPDGPLWVPDRDKECWMPSHPKAHIQYSSDLNADSCQKRAFVRLTKMMKWWWKYQFEKRKPKAASHERKPKGFWIEVMTGEYADLSEESYPELIVALMENTFKKFKSFRTTGKMPELPDPGLRDYSDAKYRTVKTSMTDDEFTFFLDVMEESLEWAKKALNASSEREASEYWQKFFGDTFLLAPEEKKESSLLSPAVAPGGLSFPNQPISPRKPGGFA